jgi:hypothetical protein
LARSIRPWPGSSPAGPSATPGPPGASRLRTMRATPPATAVPGPPGEQAGEADQDQTDRGQEARQDRTQQSQEARQGQTDRASSRSPAIRDMGHPADTADGGYVLTVTATSSSTLSRSRSLTATTGTNQLATSPATPSATWSRSATRNAPGRHAAGRRGDATSSMRFPGIRAAGPVPVTAGHAVVIITTRSKLTAGNLSKTSPGTTRGPHWPVGATPPYPRSIRSETEPGPLGSFVPPLSFRRGGRPAREQGRAGSRSGTRPSGHRRGARKPG